jgi:drug/metabolite transporter (DMT)-like permease
LTHYPVWMLIFSRSIVALMTLLPLVLWLGAPHRILTPLWPWYLARAMLFASGFAMFYAAFPFMGLAEVTTLFFAAPLMTATLAALFLQEMGWMPLSPDGIAMCQACDVENTS